MTITDKAAQMLKDDLIQRFLNTGLGFRIVNNGNGTIERAISIKIDHEYPGDKVIDSYGIKIFLDPATAAALEDYELDLNDPDGTFCLKSQKSAGTTSR